MKKVMLTLAMVLGLAMSAKAESHFTIVAPPDWTPSVTTDDPTVEVTVWFTDGTPDGPILGSNAFQGVVAADARVPVDATVFEGTNQTLCLNGYAEIQGATETRVSAVPACGTFPFPTLVPFTIEPPAVQ